jgi:protein-disulfide isomerase
MAVLLLAACSTGVQNPVAEVPTMQASAPEAESQPTEAQTIEALPTEVEPTETSAAKSGGEVSAAGSQMECTLVSDQPDVPPELEAFFGVTEDDWVVGPDSAAVTFVEYSDFQ